MVTDQDKRDAITLARYFCGAADSSKTGQSPLASNLMIERMLSGRSRGRQVELLMVTCHVLSGALYDATANAPGQTDQEGDGGETGQESGSGTRPEGERPVGAEPNDV